MYFSNYSPLYVLLNNLCIIPFEIPQLLNVFCNDILFLQPYYAFKSTKIFSCSEMRNIANVSHHCSMFNRLKFPVKIFVFLFNEVAILLSEYFLNICKSKHKSLDTMKKGCTGFHIGSSAMPTHLESLQNFFIYEKFLLFIRGCIKNQSTIQLVLAY